MFPEVSEEQLRSVTGNRQDINKALDELVQKQCASSSDVLEPLYIRFTSLIDVLADYRKSINKEETCTLLVKRDEIWREALIFYKKALNNKEVLKQKFEVSLLL